MKISVLRHTGRKLSQGAAVLLLAGISAGCSSQVSRFGGVDDFMTASTPNQREVIRPSGDTYSAGASQQVASLPPADDYGGSVSRGSLPPPASASSAPQYTPEAQPQTASIPQSSGSESVVSSVPASADSGGRVTVQPGDTIYGIARRYGVSPNALLQANGMSASDNLRSGSSIIIPGAAGSTTVASNGGGGQTLGTLPQSSSNAPSTTANSGAMVAAGTYTVQQGDTLSRISRNTGVGVAALKDANGISDGVIRVGQKLRIPGSNGGTTQVASAAPAPAPTASTKPDTAAADTAKPAAKQPEKSEQVAAYTPPQKTESVIEQSDEAAPDATGIGRMRWPVKGRVISQFGKGAGKANDGIDISVPEGTPVKAAENGVVIYAGDGLKEFGNTVLVRHEDGLVTVYGHASQIKVQRGDKVKRGQDIALSGTSGQTVAPKLHFEVRKNSAPVDPVTYLE